MLEPPEKRWGILRKKDGTYFGTISTYPTAEDAEKGIRGADEWVVPLFPLEVVAWQIQYKDSPPSVINDARR